MPYPPPPYDDAKCGVAKCGAAICGKWWGYPARGTLTLGGRPVDIAIQVAGVVEVFIGRGVLTLRGRSPVLQFSLSLTATRGQLRYVGRPPEWVGQKFMWVEPAQCTDVDLVPITPR